MNSESGSYFEKKPPIASNKHHLTLTPKTLEQFFFPFRENEIVFWLVLG